MHDHPPPPPENPTEQPKPTQTHETAPRPRPAIYVASLADYNNGHLHGEWMDAARDPADIHADITAMLARSKEPGAEEFAIHDYEQFGTCRIHEYDGIELVSRIAKGIAEHGYAFAAWAEAHESAPERFDDFTDSYLGHYDSTQEYADQLVDDLGLAAELAEVPRLQSLQSYLRIDAAAMARDMEHSGALYVAPNPDGGVWLFDGNV
ncbi:antirestriction protein ArdA [Mycolicibacterium sp. Y3]